MTTAEINNVFVQIVLAGFFSLFSVSLKAGTLVHLFTLVKKLLAEPCWNNTIKIISFYLRFPGSSVRTMHKNVL